MGLTQGWTADLKTVEGMSRQGARLRALGHALHLPSLAMVMAAIFASANLAAASPHDRCGGPELNGFGWIPESVERGTGSEARPRRAPAEAVFDEARGLFPDEKWNGLLTEMERARAKFAMVPVSELLGFFQYLDEVGAPVAATGPGAQALWGKSYMRAALSKKHRPSGARDAAASLAPEGIGKDAHEAAAVQLERPFASDPQLELDLRFAIRSYARDGPSIGRARARDMQMLKQAAESARDLDVALLAQRRCSIEGAPGARPPFIALLVALMQWPDEGLPMRLGDGFEIAGDIAPAGIYRPIEQQQVGKPVKLEGDDGLFGSGAEAFHR